MRNIIEKTEDKFQKAGDALQGLTFVISGTFSFHSRDEYKEIIEKNGGKILIPKSPHADESGYFAIFIDSEGNKIGLHSMN